jgi:hypothetical protein
MVQSTHHAGPYNPLGTIGTVPRVYEGMGERIKPRNKKEKFNEK